MGLNFNPADVQSVGIGLAAFLATVLTTFVFLSARHERLGRPMWIMLAAAMVWAWFGFLYHLSPDLYWAREMRVISVMGIVWISMSEIYFAVVYFLERRQLGVVLRAIRLILLSIGVGLTILLVADLLGTHFIVGNLLLPPHIALAPQAGPLMAVLIAYYAICTFFAGMLLALRARSSIDQEDRKQALILFVSMTVGLVLGGTRFTPWYGFDFYPFVGNVGFPLFVIAAFYLIKRYHLLNREVAAAQLFVFALWTLSFFRLLLDSSQNIVVLDTGFFLAALGLGVLLLRSVVMEARAQRQIASMVMERTKSEFITIAAHQLRTPVSALRWSFNLLAEDSTRLSDTQRAIVEKGNRAAANMARLVNDLLDIGQMTDGKFHYSFSEGDIGAGIREEARLFEDVAKQKNIELSVSIPPNLPHISYDASRLNIVLQNLIDNAIKYTNAGGRVSIEAQPAEDGVRIVIQDTGIGFSSDEKSRIFEKFFRGPRAMRVSPDGSGLGVFIAKTVVEGHGGTLTLTSEENRGSTFVISLPSKPVVGT